MDFRDAAGDRTTITWPDTGSNALAATYAYDVLQRVTSISVGGSTIASYGYDQYGRRSTVARNGGTGAGTTYGYDGADRINSLAQSLTGSGAVTWTMAYDPSSAIVSREASNTSYLWHGGAVSTAYAANGLNQYTTAGGAPLSYSDGRANLTSLSSTGPTFSFDTANDLLSASGPTAVTLTYDPVGRIQTKTSGGATETFLYAGSMLVGEYNSAGAILDRYIPGPGQDEAALWYSGSGTTTPQWLHADQQGSTIAWSNGSGASLGTQAYDPYGQPSAWSGPRYAYTGQLMIPEAQLYDYKARAYDPALGRFLQTDAAGYSSDINPYAYAGGDPVNGIDPSGMTDATQCISCIIRAIGGDSDAGDDGSGPDSNQTGAPTSDLVGNTLSGSLLSEVRITAAYNPNVFDPAPYDSSEAFLQGFNQTPEGLSAGGPGGGPAPKPQNAPRSQRANGRCLMNATGYGVASGSITASVIVGPIEAAHAFELAGLLAAAGVGAGEGVAVTWETGPGALAGALTGLVVGGIVYYAAHRSGC